MGVEVPGLPVPELLLHMLVHLIPGSDFVFWFSVFGIRFSVFGFQSAAFSSQTSRFGLTVSGLGLRSQTVDYGSSETQLVGNVSFYRGSKVSKFSRFRETAKMNESTRDSVRFKPRSPTCGTVQVAG